MKIRTGFVSNSSSSSFIIRSDATTYEIAKKMYMIMIDDYKWWKFDLPKKHKEVLDWFDKNEGFDDPIVIPWTTNYETFIWKTPSGISVDTCNNIDWSDIGWEYVCDYRSEDYSLPATKEEIFLDLGNIVGERMTREKWIEEDTRKWKEELERIRQRRENDNK